MQPTSSPIVIGRSPLLDNSAPDFSLTDLDGKQVRLADYRGRPTIVYFWASWCIPCREEFPLLLAAQRAHADAQLAVIGVIYKDTADGARGFMNAHGATWPAVQDPGEATARAYQVLGPPVSYYIDRTGVVRAISYGPPPPNVLDEHLKKIL